MKERNNTIFAKIQTTVTQKNGCRREQKHAKRMKRRGEGGRAGTKGGGRGLN